MADIATVTLELEVLKNKFKEFIDGSDTDTVTTDGGVRDSIAKAIKDAIDAGLLTGGSMTGADIAAALFGEDGVNNFTTAEKTKLGTLAELTASAIASALTTQTGGMDAASVGSALQVGDALGDAMTVAGKDVSDLVDGAVKFSVFSELAGKVGLVEGATTSIDGWWSAGDGGANVGVIVPAATGNRAQGYFDLAASGKQVKMLFPYESVNIRQFGLYHDALELETRHDDGPIWADAIQYVHDNYRHVLVSKNDDSFMSTQAELLPGVKIFARSSTIYIDGLTLKIPFITKAHCATDYTVFASGCEMHGLAAINELELPSGGEFVNYMLWHACNVHDWVMKETDCYNMGNGYVSHARRIFGTYDADMAANTLSAVDPSVTAGFSEDGGDLNENLRFEGNRCLVPERTTDGYKTLLQSFRYEFCDGVVIDKNKSTRGAISGWGGSAKVAEGGASQHYRRCRNVAVTRNYLVEPNALYCIQGYNVKISNNTVVRGIDLGIDLEGSQKCQITNNLVINSGNGSIGTFYHCQGILISGNICYEDGTAANINDEFELSGKWDPSAGNTLFINTGAHSPAEGEDEISLLNNIFVWAGLAGSGNIDIRDVTDFVGSGNRLLNVTFDSNHSNTGRVEWSKNKIVFTQDAAADALVLMGANKAAVFAPRCVDNHIFIKATQTGTSGECSTLSFSQTANDNFYTQVHRNSIIHSGGQRTTYDVSLLNSSINAGRWHVYDFLDNVFGCSVPIVDKSTRSCAHGIIEAGNTLYASTTTQLSGSVVAGESAVTVDNLPRGFALVAGQSFGYRDARGLAFAEMRVLNHGWDIPDSDVFAAGYSYGVGDVIYTSAGLVYYCTAAGTSTVEPTGNWPSDGDLSWNKMGDRCEWGESSPVGNIITR